MAGTGSFTVEGQALAPEEEVPLGNWLQSSPGYFRTLGIRLLQGRVFSEEDSESAAPVVVINQTLARRHFPSESPLGKRLVIEEGDPREIVGVVADIKHWGFREDPSPQLFEPVRSAAE